MIHLILAFIWLSLACLAFLLPWLDPEGSPWTIPQTQISIGWLALFFSAYNLARRWASPRGPSRPAAHPQGVGCDPAARAFAKCQKGRECRNLQFRARACRRFIGGSDALVLIIRRPATLSTGPRRRGYAFQTSNRQRLAFRFACQ